MKKVYIVMDEPESCDDCPLFYNEYLQRACKGNGRGIGFPYPKDFRQEWCPLKDVPKKEMRSSHEYESNRFYRIGWNACIDRIFGGEDG